MKNWLNILEQNKTIIKTQKKLLKLALVLALIIIVMQNHQYLIYNTSGVRFIEENKIGKSRSAFIDREFLLQCSDM